MTTRTKAKNSMLSDQHILHRIYSGFLGKAIGVRLGAPVEPTIWTYERIKSTYGEITGYLRDFKNFAADNDTNGLNGACFVAAMIAAAFEAESVAALFEAGMSVIDAKSEYARVVQAVQDFHAKTPDDWRACREYLGCEFGYDRYPRVCHIIPNAGAIIGTFQGVQTSWDKYRTPINDCLVASGVTGTLNIIDIPTFTRELTTLALDLDGRDVPELWRADTTRRDVRFDFALPGSTHGFRTHGINTLRLGWADRPSNSGSGALDILIDRFQRGHDGRVFWKPFYRKHDFDDERYRPMFLPSVAAGQTVKIEVQLDPMDGDGNLRVVPYVRATQSGTITRIGDWQVPASDEWDEISFTVPDTNGEAVDDIGLEIEYFGRLKFLGHLYIGNLEVSGVGHTRIDPANEVEEWGAISRFTWNRGYWKLEDGRITCVTDSDADLWTGHAYLRYTTVTADIRCEAGTSHLLTIRAQGTGRYYAGGFQGDRLVILKQDFGSELLCDVPFTVETSRSYSLSLTANGDHLQLSVDGQNFLETNDKTFDYGMCGLRMGTPGRMSVGIIDIAEI